MPFAYSGSDHFIYFLWVNIHIPSLGICVPSLGIRVPSLGIRVPSLGICVPSLGIRVPSLGIHVLSLGICVPSLGICVSSLGNHFFYFQRACFYLFAKAKLPKHGLLAKGCSVFSFQLQLIFWVWKCGFFLYIIGTGCFVYLLYIKRKFVTFVFMNKLIIACIILITILSSSCKKNYTCTCTNVNAPATSYTLHDTHAQAVRFCNQGNDINAGTTSCTLN